MADTRGVGAGGLFHTVRRPTASRTTPNDDALKFLHSPLLPITGCLLLEQTIRSSKARFYFRMRYVTGSTSPMKQMWRIKTLRSGRRKNMFAVTRLFARRPKKKKKKKCGDDVLCNLQWTAAAMTLRGGMQRLGDWVYMSNVCGSTGAVVKSQSVLLLPFFFFFFLNRAALESCPLQSRSWKTCVKDNYF